MEKKAKHISANSSCRLPATRNFPINTENIPVSIAVKKHNQNEIIIADSAFNLNFSRNITYSEYTIPEITAKVIPFTPACFSGEYNMITPIMQTIAHKTFLFPIFSLKATAIMIITAIGYVKCNDVASPESM